MDLILWIIAAAAATCGLVLLWLIAAELGDIRRSTVALAQMFGSEPSAERTLEELRELGKKLDALHWNVDDIRGRVALYARTPFEIRLHEED